MSISTETPVKPQAKAKSSCSFGTYIAGLAWWATLILAVIAVPLIGASVALAVTDNAFGQIVTFILSCWASTWLGMWLMNQANKAQRRYNDNK